MVSLYSPAMKAEMDTASILAFEQSSEELTRDSLNNLRSYWDSYKGPKPNIDWLSLVSKVREDYRHLLLTAG